MTFYGKTEDAPVGKPLRVFGYHNAAGDECQVQAHYVQFMPNHVTFWMDASADYDVLVAAESNEDVKRLQEKR